MANRSVRRALAVMAKAPAAGQTKTRLMPLLSGEEAAALYRCLLLDTLDLMAQVPCVQPIVAYTPASARPTLEAIAPPGFEFMAQRGDTLSDRLAHVMADCHQRGYGQFAALDSDSPTLPLSYLVKAFDLLDDPTNDVVIGPCDDGGYYLIGMRKPYPELFLGIVTSTSAVTAETLDRAERAGLRVALLPTWYDVDTPADLARMEIELLDGTGQRARRCQDFLEAHGSEIARRLQVGD